MLLQLFTLRGDYCFASSNKYRSTRRAPPPDSHTMPRDRAAPGSALALPKQTYGGRSLSSQNTTWVLTVNRDLCLLAVPGANAGDITAVDASVSDIDFVDTQDAHGLCG